MTADEALTNAVRLLQMAEVEPDRQLMAQWEHLGDSWIHLFELLSEKERV